MNKKELLKQIVLLETGLAKLSVRIERLQHEIFQVKHNPKSS